MGDIFRQNINEKTQIGIKAEKYINDGSLVPDNIAICTLETTLNNLENLEKGIVLDGYPRTLLQAQSLDKYLETKSLKVDKVINLTIPDDEIVSRVINRRICSNQQCGEIYNIRNNPPKIEGICDKCGAKLIRRNDDTEQTALNRVKIYHEQTAPLIQYYEQKDILISIEGTGAIEQTVKKIYNALEK